MLGSVGLCILKQKTCIQTSEVCTKAVHHQVWLASAWSRTVFSNFDLLLFKETPSDHSSFQSPNPKPYTINCAQKWSYLNQSSAGCDQHVLIHSFLTHIHTFLYIQLRISCMIQSLGRLMKISCTMPAHKHPLHPRACVCAKQRQRHQRLHALTHFFTHNVI